MEKWFYSLIICGIFLSGCTDNGMEDWKVSPTFKEQGVVMYGTEGEFGMVKENGEAGEPDFLADQGRLYRIHLLDDEGGVTAGNYKMVATHQDTGKSVKLLEQEFGSDRGQAKMSFDEAGLWRIDVTRDEERYTDFIIEVE